ncbi:T9SS type A sorting domain-containing protein [Pontibacter fetidus]|uniref:T9SS type A sorting domain-containing protein n=1 Tax=Pontibacter fetidus TaxID=2700082 RepID=A0A6B2GZU9_9BACT|nr:T9SS type A sorting domain-containing protein [Pontibacter fetidus]NDK56529.1 T9SS type A sorting domain-containing protein [Pontibacter fetidus]
MQHFYAGAPVSPPACLPQTAPKTAKAALLLLFSFLVLSVPGYGQGSYSWQPVGGAGISKAAATHTSVALDAQGKPYVAFYGDAGTGTGTRGMLMKYNGTSWVAVDVFGFANSAINSTSLVIDANGKPYVAYQDSDANKNKAVVKSMIDGAFRQVRYDGIFPNEGTGASTAGDNPAITLDKSGVPYIALQDELNGNRLSVYKYNAAGWSVVGTVGFSAGVSYNPSLKLDGNNVPYVAYQDGGASGKVTVMKYNGTSWENVGAAGISDEVATEPSLALDSNGTPFVAYSEGTDKMATVKKFNGTAWQTVGDAKFSTSGALTISLAVDALGTPFVAYRDFGNENKAALMKFNGTTWEAVGTGISAGTAFYTSLVIDAYGAPYVAFQDGANGNKAIVMKYVPAAPVITVQPVAKNVAADASTTFTVNATGDGPLRYQWQVSQDGGTTYLDIRDGLGYSGTTTSTLTIAKASIYMNGYQYRVLVHNGSATTSEAATLTVSMAGTENATVWQVIGAQGFSPGGVQYSKVAIAPDGTPYAAFSDGSMGGRATVMKYKDAKWELVGNAGFSGWIIQNVTKDQLDLAIDANGTPYIAYTDASKSDKGTVMKFNGTQWVTVGTAGFTPWVASEPALAFDASGTPYLAFEEAGATVMKFNGTTWELVGERQFSLNGSVSDLDLAMDANGNPYVVFSEFASTANWGKVMKFDGTSWATVGDGYFSSSKAAYATLELDAAGTPYVAYLDVANGDKAKVIKYNGTAWVAVGAESLPGYKVEFIDLALDSQGMPYLYYYNKDHVNQATVVKYNGSTWEFVGNAGFTQARVTDFALSKTDVPYVIFSVGKAAVMSFAPNATPTDIALEHAAVNENVGNGTIVSGFTTTDADAADTHTYTLVSGEGAEDNDHFSITDNKLQLWPSPDFETKSAYHIRVRTSDGKLNGSFEKALVLQVNDMDEIAPANYTVAFNQSLVTHNNKNAVSITVAGAEIGATYSYTITSAGGGTPVTGSGEVATATFEVNAIDVTPLADGQLTIALKLTDIAKNTGNNATAQVNKNTRYVIGASRGAFVKVPFLTTFAQLGSKLPATVEVTYLDGRKEPLAVTWLADTYKGSEAGVYELIGTLTLAEGTINPDNVTTYILVEVEPSKVPTAIALSKNTIAENNAIGAAIGTLTTTDADAGDTHTYKLVEDTEDNAFFTIEGNELKAAAIFDFETKKNFNVRVQTKDSAGMTYETTMAIAVTDVYEAPTGIADENYPGLEVYPNPATYYLIITSDKLIESVSVVNSQGKTVFAKANRGAQVQLNTEAYTPGVYTVLVTSQGKLYSRRIVIVR